MQFDELIDRTIPQNKQFRGRLLCLDPGETLGWSTIICPPIASQAVVSSLDGSAPEVRFSRSFRAGQFSCVPYEKGIDNIGALITQEQPDRIVCEDYKVYSWKAASHSWNELYTPKLIGTIQTLGHLLNLPLKFQMAQLAKGFVTDNKLREWNMYGATKGMKHARDSLRHGLYYLLFEHKKVVD